jgi:hypothetical protein
LYQAFIRSVFHLTLRVFILQLNRNGNSQHPGALAMDRLNFTYRDGTHQFWSVQDGITAGSYAGDIDNKGRGENNDKLILQK